MATSTYTTLRLGPLADVQVLVRRHPGATMMSLLADVVGGRDQGVPGEWRRIVRESLPAGAPGLVRPLFAPSSSLVPDSLTLTSDLHDTGFEDALARLADLGTDVLLGELERDFGGRLPALWRPVVDRPAEFLAGYTSLLRALWTVFEPIWQRADGLLGRETEKIGTAVVSGTLDPILAGISPRARFAADTLLLPDPHPEAFELAGRRLVLVPIASGSGASAFSVDREDLVWIGYPLPGLGLLSRVRGRAAVPTESVAPGGDALSLVLGPVRAAILRHSGHGTSAGELADRVGVSPAGLSYHISQLVAAGLLRRDRQGRRVRLTRSERGAALMDLLS